MNIQQLLSNGTTMLWAEHYVQDGRISQRTFDWFCLFSAWSAPRFSGSAGMWQDRVYNTCGHDFYWRRIERMKALHDSVRDGHVTIKGV